ncbi:FAD-dependent oxidoreductase [Agrococcus carbonis]|uniref:2-polyprenyl-6-methoxyphenol hydroxylase n=1 Tax=Agrococcus carbonis TaxID=684552 RepID=A0A1H1QNC2_9MICO|nr:NAD(P)/FAD-dependent oxidoreductase [Agrococcus carbonis]SDS24833.1 2-polyprenyl-6-methoxyphenol hydroxylase [Agrococcus carbonis]
MSPRHDVAVVGGGAVGVLLACLLAQRGADVVVLERRTAEPTGARAIGIHPPGLAALDAVGIGEAVRREAIPIRRGIALSGARELARMRFAPQPILALPQHRTEALLRRRLAALAPDALREGAEVTGLAERPGSVVLELADGVVEAAWAVGADGVRSRVRALLGIGWQPRPGTAGYAMADAPDDAVHGGGGVADAAALHLEPDGIVEAFPMPGGLRRWVVRLDEPVAQMSAGELQAILDARLRQPPRLPSTAVPSAFTARQRLASALVRGRVALAGDAAHEVSPIGGQGMSLGWLDALALDRALSRPAPGDGPLAAYDRDRRRAAQRAMRRAAWNMSMGAPARGPALALRLAAVRALALPPARSVLARAFTMRGL